MESTHIRIILSAIFMILSVVSGIWLHQKGRPLHKGIFSAHKLVSMAATVFIVLIFFAIKDQVQFSANQMTFIVLSGMFLLLTFVSGGMLSVEKPFTFIVFTVHRIMTLLLIIFGGYTAYLLVGVL